MKKILIIAVAFCLAACTQKSTVEVTNTSATDYTQSSVEVNWQDLAIEGLTAENVVVKHKGVEIPSQPLIIDGKPVVLLFQADVKAGGTERYTVEAGTRSNYPTKAYGRHVPERLDDYAWENDKVAFRAYGPALEVAPGEMLATPGFDTWVKCVDTLVVDARYKRGNYHHNYGDGMDCYKVGRTLGAGASAPLLEDGELALSRNYATFDVIANGPIRTLVRLTYAPFKVGEIDVTLTKFISLDAGSHFNHIMNIYEGDFKTLPIVAGFIRHNVKSTTIGENYITMCEPASDSHNPEEDGDIYLAVIQNNAQFIEQIAGHTVALRHAENGEPVEYLAGVAWSGAGIDDAKWKSIIEAEVAAYTKPLTVTVK